MSIAAGTSVAASDSDAERYYYLPGDRVVWNYDSAAYQPGGIPARMQLESGQMELRKIDNRRFLTTVHGCVALLDLPENLPHRFSIEIEYESPHAQSPFLFDTKVDNNESDDCTLGSVGPMSFVECDGNRHAVSGSLPQAGMIHARFTVDGTYVSGYLNEQLLPPLPDVKIARGRRIRMHIPGGSESNPTRVSSVRIAAGGRRHSR